MDRCKYVAIDNLFCFIYIYIYIYIYTYMKLYDCLSYIHVNNELLLFCIIYNNHDVVLLLGICTAAGK